MVEFFKYIFRPYLGKIKGRLNKAVAMQEQLNLFSEHYFGSNYISLEPHWKNEFQNSLILLVMSHQYAKEESISSMISSLDFSIIRDPMYKYSKKTEDRFFDHSPLAYLFWWFSSRAQAQQFVMQSLKAKKGNDNQFNAERVQEEIQRMREELSSQGGTGDPFKAFISSL
mmetsp:Transcript_1108/g.1113  ORF Transcript_1108/g.1113 Transcript_1108/m.1113 type:complete len:170 (+) Transcript_1108:1159-1668(+)